MKQILSIFRISSETFATCKKSTTIYEVASRKQIKRDQRPDKERLVLLYDWMLKLSLCKELELLQKKPELGKLHILVVSDCYDQCKFWAKIKTKKSYFLFFCIGQCLTGSARGGSEDQKKCISTARNCII